MSRRRPKTDPEAPATEPAVPMTLADLQRSIARIQDLLGQPRITPVYNGPKAKVKLDLRTKTDAELGEFVRMHIKKMENNPDFPEPLPPADEFDAIATTYSQTLIAAIAVQSLARQVTAQLATARTDLQNAVRTRGSYIQVASGGNPVKILNTGFETWSDPSPTGDLPSPKNLTATPTRNSGELIFTWEAVEGARTYLLQQSDASTPERNWISLKPSTGRKLTVRKLPTGVPLAFRIATAGGTGGQSEWSYEIVRMVG